MANCVIKDVAVKFPEKEYTNDDIRKEHPNYNIDRFEKKVGIVKRYIVDENETALDLAISASKELINNNKGCKIDYILYCTQSPEYILPSTACILQDKLGLPTTVGALDFNLGCSGYTYGLQLAKGLICSGDHKTILLVTAETYSKYINPEDVVNKAIFGDAATATLIESSDIPGVMKTLTRTDGNGFDKLIVKNGGTRNHFEVDPEIKKYANTNYYNNNNLYMNGPDIFNFTIENIPELFNDLLEVNNKSMSEIDFFIFHQANAFMLNFLATKIGIPKDKFYIDIREGGNTVSNTLPIALKRSIDKKLIRSGNLVMLIGFGVGLSYSGTIIKIN